MIMQRGEGKKWPELLTLPLESVRKHVNDALLLWLGIHRS